MKKICVLLCSCTFFVSSFATNATKGFDGNIGKQKQDFPFCPADKNTLRQIKEITAILQGNVTRKKPDCKRVRRAASSCDVFPFPRCSVLSLIIFHGVNVIHQPLVHCCTACKDVEFPKCLHVDKKPCPDCIHQWTACMNKCTTVHFCPGGTVSPQAATTVQFQSKEPIIHQRIKTALKPIQTNPCPTRKVKFGKSYCIKRTCFPLQL